MRVVMLLHTFIIYTTILLKSVCRKVAILARSFPEISQTVCIDWKHFLSRVRVSVQPQFIRENTQNYREYRVARATDHLNEAATGHCSPAELAKRSVNCITVGCHRPIEQWQPERRWQCVCVCVRARHVFAIYDNNIWPRLIIIIIKTIILYFIQITHTDDFSSTGTRLGQINCQRYINNNHLGRLNSFISTKMHKRNVSWGHFVL